MPDKKRISGYIPPSEHETVKRRAETNDQSVSEYVVEAVREKVDRDSLGSAAQQYRIEERLMNHITDMTTEAADQAADRITDQILETLEARGRLAPEEGDPGDSSEGDGGRGDNIIEFD